MWSHRGGWLGRLPLAPPTALPPGALWVAQVVSLERHLLKVDPDSPAAFMAKPEAIRARRRQRFFDLGCRLTGGIASHHTCAQAARADQRLPRGPAARARLDVHAELNR